MKQRPPGAPEALRAAPRVLQSWIQLGLLLTVLTVSTWSNSLERLKLLRPTAVCLRKQLFFTCFTHAASRCPLHLTLAQEAVGPCLPSHPARTSEASTSLLSSWHLCRLKLRSPHSTPQAAGHLRASLLHCPTRPSCKDNIPQGGDNVHMSFLSVNHHWDPTAL